MRRAKPVGLRSTLVSHVCGSAVLPFSIQPICNSLGVLILHLALVGVLGGVCWSLRIVVVIDKDFVIEFEDRLDGLEVSHETSPIKINDSPCIGNSCVLGSGRPSLVEHLVVSDQRRLTS
jgi:hypothetical protein